MKQNYRVERQLVQETTTHLILTMHQPYWKAWQRYGWEYNVEGFGLSRKVLALAREKKKKIMVKLQNKRYEITPVKAEQTALKYNSYMLTANNVSLLEIPRTAFKDISLPAPEVLEPTGNLLISKSVVKFTKNNPAWEALRAKLKGGESNNL